MPSQFHTRSSPGDVANPQGLFRTTIAGPGGSLADAFANIERSPHVTRLVKHPKRDLVTARVALTPQEGHGHWELTRIRDDLYVILTDFAYRDLRMELVPGDGLVQFNFKVSGDMTYAISRPGPLRFNRPALHVWRQAQGIDMREWTAPKAHERWVAISVRPEFLAEHFLASRVDIPPRLQSFVSKPVSSIDYCLLPLTAQMIDVTNRLIENPYTEALALAYTEALALELLCLAVGDFCSLSDEPAEQYSEREIKCLEAVRDLLMQQLAPTPTLKKIARSVGLGEKALTSGFKALYGETIFDFSVRCRMQHALALLRDRRWPVDRVSEAVGYSHPTSFATAFRRHFGMRPVDVKRLQDPAVADRRRQRGRIS
jgi:AraC-like DNA-binding protein